MSVLLTLMSFCILTFCIFTLIFSGQTEVHVGVTETINLEIELHNSGENAFLSRVVTMCPVQLSVVGVHSKIVSSSIFMQKYHEIIF